MFMREPARGPLMAAAPEQDENIRKYEEIRTVREWTAAHRSRAGVTPSVPTEWEGRWRRG